MMTLRGAKRWLLNYLLDDLFPDDESVKNLAGVVNSELVQSSYVAACSGRLLCDFSPISEFQMSHVISSIKNIDELESHQVTIAKTNYGLEWDWSRI